MLTRRQLIKRAAALAAAAALRPADLLAHHSTPERNDNVQPIHTVTGPLPPTDLGVTLIHEHITCDFVGADNTGPHRWNQDEVAEVMLPYLADLRAAGADTFVDCSPKFLGRDPVLLKRLSEASGLHIITNTGRDPVLLKRLSEASGLHIITNTGLYKDPYLPPYALEGTAESLADDWTREAEEGIEDTGIRPGFIKIAANEGPLNDIQKKIVRAAALTHLRTGLTIAAHTTVAKTAIEELDLLAREGVDPSAFIWVHADAEEDHVPRRQAAERGAWVELDAVDPGTPQRHIAMLRDLLDAGLIDHALISQDAGWYNVGEPRGGAQRPFHKLLTDFVPALEDAGIARATIDKLLVDSPRRALEPRIRKT